MAEQPSQRPDAPAGASEDADAPTVHHVSRRKKQGPRAGSMQLNLTAMIDVTFQLLIYFVVTANFALDEGTLTARMPEGTGQSSQEQLEPTPTMPLNIELNPVGSTGVNVTVEGRRVASFTELAGRLQQLQTSGAYPADNPVKIRPKGEVRYQHVLNAFDAAVGARYSDVAITRATE